jgi:PAS domain S-box-containing protein
MPAADSDIRLEEIRARLRTVPDPVALLEGIFAHAPVGLQVYAASGHCLLTNRAFRDLFGSEPPPEYNVLHDDVAERAGVLQHVRRAFAGETVALPPVWYDPRELRQVTVQEGRRVAIEATFFPLFDAHGAITQVACVFRDVTAAMCERERAERSERRYRILSATVAELIWTTDATGALIENSEDWHGFTGQPVEGSLGWGWLDMVHPDDRDLAETTFREAVAAGTSFEAEYRLRRADGTHAITVARAAPVRDASGQLVEWVGMHVDVTEQRRMAEQLRVFAALIENSPDFVGIADATGEPFYANPAGLRMVEFPPGQPVSSTAILDWYAPEVRPFARDVIVQTVLREGHWSGETYFRNWRTGAAIPVSDSHFLIREPGSDRVLGMATITRDISDRRRAEREHDDLLARERAARAEAEAASRAKDEFLAMLGHELRNPLSPIVVALQLLRLRDGARWSRELQVIERQVDHLLRLVDDLLDVSRITRGKIELKREPVELAGAIAKAIEMASPLLEQRRHHLRHDVPAGLWVHGDAVRLAQVVANLLTNAAKYTEPGGTIAITARSEADALVVSVADTGMGIEPQLLPHLFELFVQGARPPDRAEGGLGLGLALVKSLVELHGGTVQARSEGRGRGSEFVVRLPALPPLSLQAPTTAPTPARPWRTTERPRQVLVVDDNRDAADLLAETLRAAGHQVEVAHDGPDALARLERFRPEVAVLDIGLPVMDGYELAVRLRDRVAGVHLLALTGYGQDRDRERSRAAGFAHHFVKPIDPDRLLEAVAASPPAAAGG